MRVCEVCEGPLDDGQQLCLNCFSPRNGCKYSPAQHKDWLDACLRHENRLSDWERLFVRGVSGGLRMGASLTLAQELKLEGIYARRTP